MQNHKFSAYLIVGGFAILVGTIPAFAAVKTQQMNQKQAAMVQQQKASTPHMQQQIQQQFKKQGQETFDQHKQAVLKLLTAIETELTKAEEQVNTSVTLSPETKTETLAAIDIAQTEIDDLQKQVEEATTTQELIAARKSATQWLIANKDLLKTVGIDLYVESLQTVVDTDTVAVLTAKAQLIPLMKAGVNVTTYKELIGIADSSVKDEATPAVKVVTEDASQENLITASIATLEATEDVLAMVEEGENLSIAAIQ